MSQVRTSEQVVENRHKVWRLYEVVLFTKKLQTETDKPKYHISAEESLEKIEDSNKHGCCSRPANLWNFIIQTYHCNIVDSKQSECEDQVLSVRDRMTPEK